MGALVRRIAIATRAREARAAVEDDFHHFRVTILHDGLRVTGANTEALRRPWTACADAGARLNDLIGMPLAPRAAAIHERADQKFQCTHMFDLAGLAIAAAARGIAVRRYEAIVPDRVAGATTPRLSRNNEEVLRWSLDGSRIAGPAPFTDIDLRAGFSAWTDTLVADLAEAALVLRRAVFIAGGRGIDLDRTPHPQGRGGCFVQQPGRAETARRMFGSTVDCSTRAEPPLEGDRTWLSFET